MAIEVIDGALVGVLPVIDQTVIALDPAVIDGIAPTDPAPTDPAPTETAPTDPASVDTAPVDTAPVDGGTSDVPPGAESFGGPVDVPPVDHGIADPTPVDPAPVDPTAVDPAVDGSTAPPVDDGAQNTDGTITILHGEVLTDYQPKDPVPSDPAPGDSAPTDGTDTAPSDGSDVPVPIDWIFTDFGPIYDKIPVDAGSSADGGSSDGQPPLIYTMTGGDPVELGAVAYSTAETPTRGSHDPLPYERTTTVLDGTGAEDPASASGHQLIHDFDALHYSATLGYHTGLFAL